jgi:hypothetical protein
MGERKQTMIKASHLNDIRYLLRQIQGTNNELNQLNSLPAHVTQSQGTYHNFGDFTIESSDIITRKEMVKVVDAKKYLIIKELENLGVEYDIDAIR